MHEVFEGQCQCGAVTYRVTGSSVTLFACHCSECQRQSASAFGMALWVKATSVLLQSGELKDWVRSTPSGKKMIGKFCPNCGTRVFHKVVGQEEVLSIKPGTLYEADRLAPVGHIWTSSKQAWIDIPTGLLQYQQGPPDFKALMNAWSTEHPNGISMRPTKSGTMGPT